jgi:ATP-dependent DNA helicase RecQ
VTSSGRGLELLRVLTGNPAAEFHTDQWAAIEQVVVDRSRLLVVQRTGWGKSAVYFIATRMLRDAGAGPTLLVSPLLALMRNQIQSAERAGVRAATVNSQNRDDWQSVADAVSAGEVDILLVSPERLNNIQFRRDVLPELVRTAGLLVIDEAHCISDWGHDFRPDYRRLTRVIEMLPPTVPVLCTTATANDRVIEDIRSQLGATLTVLRGTLDRASLRLGVVPARSHAERLAWLAAFVASVAGTGIVYCLTIADTDRVADWLRSQGIDAVAYSGSSDDGARIDVEDRLLSNDVKVVVATSALGMGFDKPDISFVIHYQSPGSTIAYYQQVGRAGRSVADSVGVMLVGAEDDDIHAYFRDIAFPDEAKSSAVLSFLASRSTPTSSAAIEGEVNIRRGRLEAMLKVLAVEGAVENVVGGWVRTSTPWEYDRERVAAVTARRNLERARIREYSAITSCRMLFLRADLDDANATPCGRCDNCTGIGFDMPRSPALVDAALRFLRKQDVVIDPRRQWPVGVPGHTGRIPPNQQLKEGRALSLSGDGGWGTEIRRLVTTGGGIASNPAPAVAEPDVAGGNALAVGFPPPSHVVSDDLLDAVVALIGRWKPPVAWVTSVPSSRPLVADFAERLAARLGLPMHLFVTRVPPGRPKARWKTARSRPATSSTLSRYRPRFPLAPFYSSTTPSRAAGRSPALPPSCPKPGCPPSILSSWPAPAAARKTNVRRRGRG